MRSARGERGCVGGGGATTLSDSSMSSSDEEKVTALFRPGRDDPDDFFRKVRIDTSHKKRRDNAQLVGELMRRIASEEDAEELLQWVDANQVPVPAGHVGGPVNQMQLRAPEGAAAEGPGAPPEAVAVATTNDLQRAFARKFPMTGAQDRAQEELERIKQRTGIRAHNRAYCKGLMKSGKVANTTPAEVQLLTGRTDRMAYVKSTSKVVHEMIEEEFSTVESMRAHLLKRLHNLGNVHALQHEAEAYEANELEPIAISAQVPGAAYWLKGKSKKKSKGANAVEALGEEECLLIQDMHHNQLETLSCKLEETRQEMKEMEQRQQEKSELRMKEHKREIEDDIIKPLGRQVSKLEEMVQQSNQTQTEMLNILKKQSNSATSQPAGTGYVPNQQRWNQGGYQRRGFAANRGAPKRPLICFNCKKEGHPFRLCPELTVNAVMEVAAAVRDWDQGGTEVCSLEEIRSNFDKDQVMDEDLLCNVVSRWVEENAYTMAGGKQEAIQSYDISPKAIQVTEEQKASLHQKSQVARTSDQCHQSPVQCSQCSQSQLAEAMEENAARDVEAEEVESHNTTLTANTARRTNPQPAEVKEVGSHVAGDTVNEHRSEEKEEKDAPIAVERRPPLLSRVSASGVVEVAPPGLTPKLSPKEQWINLKATVMHLCAAAKSEPVSARQMIEVANHISQAKLLKEEYEAHHTPPTA